MGHVFFQIDEEGNYRPGCFWKARSVAQYMSKRTFARYNKRHRVTHGDPWELTNLVQAIVGYASLLLLAPDVRDSRNTFVPVHKRRTLCPSTLLKGLDEMNNTFSVTIESVLQLLNQACDPVKLVHGPWQRRIGVMKWQAHYLVWRKRGGPIVRSGITKASDLSASIHTESSSIARCL